MGIDFRGQKDIDNPLVWVFAEVVVCLDCGAAEFTVPEAELRQLRRKPLPPRVNTRLECYFSLRINS